MYSYQNSPREGIENVDLQIIIFGIQINDLFMLFMSYAVMYFCFNSLIGIIATILLFVFFKYMQERRFSHNPLELNRKFSHFCKKFKLVGNYFESSSHLIFEEEVYRE